MIEALLNNDFNTPTEYVEGNLRLSGGGLNSHWEHEWSHTLVKLRAAYQPFQPFMKALARYGIDNVPLDACVMPDGTLINAESFLSRRQKADTLAIAA